MMLFLYFSVNITRNKEVFVLSILLFLIICSIPNNPGIISLKYREIPIPGLYKLIPNLQPYWKQSKQDVARGLKNFRGNIAIMCNFPILNFNLTLCKISVALILEGELAMLKKNFCFSLLFLLLPIDRSRLNRFFSSTLLTRVLQLQ